MTPRSCLRWKPTGKIFKTVGLRWVPTGKIFASSTTKVDSEPLNGLDADITNQYDCEQTLDVSAGTLNLSVGTSFNLKEEGRKVCSELGLHDHNNKPISSKLVPNVVPPACMTATTRQALELLFCHHITMLRLLIRVLCISLEIMPEHLSDTYVFTMKMEILLESTANKLLVASVITYTSVNTDSEPWRFQWVPEPKYPKYLEPSDVEAPIEDQPLPYDASPTALSPGYIANSDSEEDPVDYPVDKGEDVDDESSDDDDDDDDDEEDKEDDEEEENLASAKSSTVPTVDPVPLAEDTEAFETDESAPTHVASPRRCMDKMSIRPPTSMPDTPEALIAEYASAPTPPLLPPSPLSSLSSLLAQIPLPPLLVPSPPTTIHSYAKVPLGYRATKIRLRDVPPPLLLLSTFYMTDIPKAEMPL
nr:hypothetical protein [Tanacetum cinerariifolium]